MNEPKKEIFTVSELEAIGYPEKVLREISRSEDFYKVGFRSGRKIYFHKGKLEKHIERREQING